MIFSQLWRRESPCSSKAPVSSLPLLLLEAPEFLGLWQPHPLSALIFTDIPLLKISSAWSLRTLSLEMPRNPGGPHFEIHNVIASAKSIFQIRL